MCQADFEKRRETEKLQQETVSKHAIKYDLSVAERHLSPFAGIELFVANVNWRYSASVKLTYCLSHFINEKELRVTFI